METPERAVKAFDTAGDTILAVSGNCPRHMGKAHQQRHREGQSAIEHALILSRRLMHKSP